MKDKSYFQGKVSKLSLILGNRYSSEWIMQCMLMNMRSPSNYEFIRKNRILPLPSTKTVRNYFSLIDIKCGLDQNFKQLLKEHFKKKSVLQSHGILVLDEISLRKSLKVSAKNLTYSGLSDFGETEGMPKADSIEDLATHGLVIMFQPMYDNYVQPIACFASKNQVKGDDLAKIMIKGKNILKRSYVNYRL